MNIHKNLNLARKGIGKRLITSSNFRIRLLPTGERTFRAPDSKRTLRILQQNQRDRGREACSVDRECAEGVETE